MNQAPAVQRGLTGMSIILCLGIGLAIGMVSGALGIGGGVLLVPALIWLGNLDPRTAAGTTLAVLVVPVVLPAAWEYYANGYLHVKAAAWIAVAFAVGGFIGARLAVQHYLPESELRLVFGLMMIYIAVRFLMASSSEAARALVGLLAVTVAWVAYLGLRALGRRHRQRPDLGEQIRLTQQQGLGDPEYHI
jgi:uncharacterized membrane protein YfcA